MTHTKQKHEREATDKYLKSWSEEVMEEIEEDKRAEQQHHNNKKKHDSHYSPSSDSSEEEVEPRKKNTKKTVSPHVNTSAATSGSHSGKTPKTPSPNPQFLQTIDPTMEALNKMKPLTIFPGHAELSFFGGAGTVTGSKHLITMGDLNVLVDCGMYQGLKELREKNWDPISSRMAVEHICDAIIITHAHLDHTGYLPRMVRLGYRGPIYMTRETRQLAEIVLLDSAHLQEEDAKYANKKKFSSHEPALPFITTEDVARVFTLVVEVDYHTPVTIHKNNDPHHEHFIEFTYYNAGHILGSSYVYVKVKEQKILFSGDLGTMKSLKSLQETPELPSELTPDTVLIESTYGDRYLQAQSDAVLTEDFVAPQLEQCINYIYKENGVCLIPAFSIGRAQVIAYMLLNLMEKNKIPDCPVHIDTPMGSKAMNYYVDSISSRPDLDDEEKKHITALLKKVQIHESTESSKKLKLNTLNGATKCIIISSAGMLTGGRVIHHLIDLLPKKENLVLLSGYQAAGTRGRLLLEGAKHLKMHGESVPVVAKVEKLNGISAHADAGDLMKFLRAFKTPPKQVFVIHGEPESSRTLARAIAEDMKVPATVPKRGTTYHLVTAPQTATPQVVVTQTVNQPEPKVAVPVQQTQVKKVQEPVVKPQTQQQPVVIQREVVETLPTKFLLVAALIGALVVDILYRMK